MKHHPGHHHRDHQVIFRESPLSPWPGGDDHQLQALCHGQAVPTGDFQQRQSHCQDMLPELEAGVFLDSDIVLLEDIAQLWDRLEYLGELSSSLSSGSPCSPPSQPWHSLRWRLTTVWSRYTVHNCWSLEYSGFF